jgi:hypothetical protein
VLLVAIGVLVARADAAPSSQWWSWWRDGADDGELAADAADADGAVTPGADGGGSASGSSIGNGSGSGNGDADGDGDGNGIGNGEAETIGVATGGALVLTDPSTGDASASQRLRRRSKWGAVDVTLGARRQWTLPRGGSPAIWNTLWLVATWRH